MIALAPRARAIISHCARAALIARPVLTPRLVGTIEDAASEWPVIAAIAFAGGKSIRFNLGMGDLFVMGGTCQRTWMHTVPKQRSVAGPRISIMFRSKKY